MKGFHYSEVFRIVEGAFRGDLEKVKNYTNLLADKAAEDGDDSTAERLRKIATGEFGARITQPRPMVPPPARFRFVRDDDGHDYLIPAEKREAFDAWLEHQQKLWGESHTDAEFKRLEAEYTGEDFNDYRSDYHPSMYTFENPKADK